MIVEIKRLNKEKIEIKCDGLRNETDSIYDAVYIILNKKYPGDIQKTINGIYYKGYKILERKYNVKYSIDIYENIEDIGKIIKEYLNEAKKNIEEIDKKLNTKIIYEL